MGSDNSIVSYISIKLNDMTFGDSQVRTKILHLIHSLLRIEEGVSSYYYNYQTDNNTFFYADEFFNFSDIDRLLLSQELISKIIIDVFNYNLETFTIENYFDNNLNSMESYFNDISWISDDNKKTFFKSTLFMTMQFDESDVGIHCHRIYKSGDPIIKHIQHEIKVEEKC